MDLTLSRKAVMLNIRRMRLDPVKAMLRPGLLELAEVIGNVPGVEGVNITVAEIDLEPVGLEVTVQGDAID
jgi:hypothetical protein